MLTATAFAASSAHMNTGCGLGTMLFKGNADNSTILQTFQATTNGISGNQTFGITTGTSDCKQPAKFVSNERANEFVLANMDNLAKDIAMGKGETLDAFAELMGVPVEKRAEFAAKLQSSFSKIYTSDQVVMANVMDNITTVSAQ
jgi:hypothetical protein